MAGLDDQDRRLVTAYRALYPVLGLVDNAHTGLVSGRVTVLLSDLRAAMGDDARRRCARWERIYHREAAHE
jgi:hypothetical protein